MIRHNAVLFLYGLCLMYAVQPVFADAPAKPVPVAKVMAPPLAMSAVLQTLHMNNYDIIRKITLDSGFYVVDAVTLQGKVVPVLMKADTGVITKPKQNPTLHLTLLDAVKKVEGSGYHDISMAEFSGTKYILKAVDQKGKKVKLKVNGATGEISKSWF